MKKVKIVFWLVITFCIVSCGFYQWGYQAATEEHSLDFGDVNDVDFEYIDFNEPATYDLIIFTNDGKELRIEVDEGIKIVGDANMNEAAEIFFHKYIKEMADAYIKQKLKEPEPLADNYDPNELVFGGDINKEADNFFNELTEPLADK